MDDNLFVVMAAVLGYTLLKDKGGATTTGDTGGIAAGMGPTAIGDGLPINLDINLDLGEWAQQYTQGYGEENVGDNSGGGGPVLNILDKGEVAVSGEVIGFNYPGRESVAIVPTEVLVDELGAPEGLGASAAYSESGGSVVNIGGLAIPVGTAIVRETGENEITVSQITQHEGPSGAGTPVIETESYRADRVTPGGYYYGGSEGEYLW